jgi:tRNA threonylcarbamoyladenosine biosynthesis protein TsaE
VILLEGDLGAGKTTFTKVLANELGIESDTVHSPTFILKKSYDAGHSLFKKLVHIDAYRFIHPQESKVLRLEDDLKDPQTAIVIEWPSKMHFLKADIEIIFKVIDDDTREVTLVYEENI